MAEWLSNTETAKRTLERHGATVRIWQAFTGNDPGLSATLVAEFDDMESYGRIIEALSQDSEWREFQQALQSETIPAATLTSRNLVTEITTI